MTDGQDFREELRKTTTRKLKGFARVCETPKIARVVDGQAFEKCMISQYATYSNNLRKEAGTDDGIEKARAQYGSGYHSAELPLNKCFEDIYYNIMGKGVSGLDLPDKIGTMYKCPHCGTQYQMSMKLMPERCLCGHLTPLGILHKEYPSWYKK